MNWHTLSPEQTCTQLDTHAVSGLNPDEAQRRLVQYGPNRLRTVKPPTFWSIFLEEVREPMIVLLLVTGVLYTLWGELSDALTIFAVILTLTAVEVWNEYRAKRAISALRQLAEPTALVSRDGQEAELRVEQIVPGDVLLLQAGRRVPADARLLQSYSLAADESALTGESQPVEKDAVATLPESSPLAERSNLVFAGTTLTRGRGLAVAVATGMATEIGRIAALSHEVKPPRTPLQVAMKQLSRSLVGLALGFSLLVPLLGWLLTRQPLQQMLLTGLSLAFATIPEEMPIIITMVLGLGGYRLSRKHAIVKDLQAVETLGAVTVIATDKTGTLTENRMQVKRWYPEGAQRALLEMGALCNDAVDVSAGRAYRGDALDVALLRAAGQVGLEVAALRDAHPLYDEFTFDNARKRMSVVTQHRIVTKGAPEAVLACCTRQRITNDEQPLADADRRAILDADAQMAGQGMRVIALAEKESPGTRLTQEQAESDLAFVGLLGMADAPRAEVRAAIEASRRAGIRTLMITGDHPLTARAIAEQVGLDVSQPMLTGPELDTLSPEALQEAVMRTSVYARTTPEHKLRIVQALRARGERVAVTGDGINDAPALVAADIGIAMGETGTDVAREAADIVLADDNYATIVRAVEESRVLYDNLKKGVRYYLACKVALVSASLLPVLLRVPVPFAPVQIILMELFMDLAASATFVAEPAEADVMRQPPRDPAAHFMDRAMVASILMSGTGLFAAVSASYLLTWYRTGNLVYAQSMAFAAWLLGHVFLALNLRSEREPLFRLGPFSNRLMILWGLAAAAFVLLATALPGVQTALKTTALRPTDWMLVLATALLGTGWQEVRKLLTYGRS